MTEHLLDRLCLRPELSDSWRLVQLAEDGFAYKHDQKGLMVVMSVDTELDGKLWLHVSVSRRGRTPSYDDLALIKKLFVGRARKAVMVFPDETNHVNIHPNCLHLFSCLEGDSLPEFSRGSGSI